MRFDTPVYFQKIVPGQYDSATGDYLPDKIAETLCYADVTNAGKEMVQLLYGTLKQNVQVIRIKNRTPKEVNRIRIASTIYNVDFVRNLRTKSVLVVSEVQ